MRAPRSAGVFPPPPNSVISSMDPRITVLLAGNPSWSLDLIHGILEAHDMHILREGVCGVTALVIGHSYPGPIDFLIADAEYRSGQGGFGLAANLSATRPEMGALFYRMCPEGLFLIEEGRAADARGIPFTPATLMQRVSSQSILS
jgi:hypothetical protein